MFSLHVDDLLVLRHMPRNWTIAANEDKQCFWLPLHESIDAHYISLQPYDSKRIAIVLDVDSEINVDGMRALGIPLPKTFTGRKRHCSEQSKTLCDRPHLIYWLDQPTWMNRRQQANLYEDVCARLAQLVNSICIVDCVNPVTTKNPAKCHYGTEDLLYHVIRGDDRIWGLEELHDAIQDCEKKLIDKGDNSGPFYKVDNTVIHSVSETGGGISKLNQNTGKHSNEHVLGLGRNEVLFQKVRFLAYGYKAYASSEADLRSYVLERCEQFNQRNFPQNPLGLAEMNQIAKSIAKWTWRKYTASGRPQKDYGACKRAGLTNESMARRQKQAAGGRYAAQKKASNTEKKVFEAIAKRQSKGEDIVISQIARELSVSRQTVRKYVRGAPEGLGVEQASEAVAGVVTTVHIREDIERKDFADAALPPIGNLYPLQSGETDTSIATEDGQDEGLIFNPVSGFAYRKPPASLYHLLWDTHRLQSNLINDFSKTSEKHATVLAASSTHKIVFDQAETRGGESHLKTTLDEPEEGYGNHRPIRRIRRATVPASLSLAAFSANSADFSSFINSKSG